MIRLSIIIVNYNVKAYLEQALHSIFRALKDTPAEVFVVDNASSDGSVQMLQNNFPRVHVIANSNNPGFAKANNQAIQKAKGNYVCLINPDTLVREDTFDTCLAYLDEHTDVGMTGCKILNPDGTLQLACRRSFPTPWVSLTKVTGLSALFPKSHLFAKYNLTYLDPDKPAEVDAISGSFMFVRKSTIDAVGGLDEDFFMYGEDLDWCYRIHQAGWKIMYLPDTQIIHYKGRSTFEASFDQLNVFYKAMQLFVQKHFQKGWMFIPKWFLILGIWLRGSLSFFLKLSKRLIIPLIDTAFLQLALILAIYIRFANLDYWSRYYVVNIIYTSIWLFCLFTMGLYRKGIFSASRALGGIAVGFIFNTSLTFFLPQFAFSRLVILISTSLDVFLIPGWRIAIRLASRWHRIPFLGTVGSTWGRRRAVIVGTGEASRHVWQKLRNQLGSGYDLIGFLAMESNEFQTEKEYGVHILGLFDDLERIARVHRVQEIIVPPEALSYHKVLNAIVQTQALNLDFKMVPREADVLIGRTSIDQIDEIPLVNLEYALFTGINPFLKRSFDLFISFLALPFALAGWLMCQMNSEIQIKKRWVETVNDKKMPVYLPFKKEKPLKGFRRNALLLWQVFTGRLSLVGSDIEGAENNSLCANYKPGITGLTQLNLWKNLTAEEVERYHLYYLKNYTILLDIEIILRTLLQNAANQ